MRLIREDGTLALSRKCELAGVSRSSLYYEPRPADGRRLALQLLVDRLYMEFPYYGTRRVSLHLQREGHAVGRGLARSLMAAVNWRTVHPGPRTSKPHPGHRIYPYLIDGLEQILPGEVICADITHIPVRGGFLYLVAIMDWASRFVLAWELDNTLGGGFLRERVDRGAGAIRCAADLEYGPGRPVHERGVYSGCWTERGCAGQHGRPGAMDRQPVYRATMAVAEVRGGVPGGAGWRPSCAPGDCLLAGPLQPIGARIWRWADVPPRKFTSRDVRKPGGRPRERRPPPFALRSLRSLHANGGGTIRGTGLTTPHRKERTTCNINTRAMNQHESNP